MLLYELTHPLELLLFSPPNKEAFKKLAKAKITDYWESKLRSAALPVLDRSLCYFHPQFMSLQHPHKLLLAAGNKPYEVSKAIIQIKFLGCQYPCGERTRHWTPTNPQGLCTAAPCYSSGVVESREHVLLHCPAYSSVRERMLDLCSRIQDPASHLILARTLLCDTPARSMQLLLDCSANPEVILTSQTYGDRVFADLFYIGRTWCFSVHREWMKRLGFRNFSVC